MTTLRYAAEFVFPGHPDKLSDAIADALVQEAARRQRRALCGVEVAVHRGRVFITGRIACSDAAELPIEDLVRGVYRSAGYSPTWEPAPEQLRIETDLCLGPLTPDEEAFRRVADDQTVLTGYAVNLPGTNYLPPEHWLAQRLGRALFRLREQSPQLQLGPDGKLLVTIVEEDGSLKLESFSVSLQQQIGGSEIELRRAVQAVVGAELEFTAAQIPHFNPAIPEQFTINGAGNFAVGGPEGDNGLSGKKLVVDAYGPRVAIGGGALSGKDFFKADRAGAILARRIAKAIVLTGAASECRVVLAFHPGDEQARVIQIVGDRVALPNDSWSGLFDRSLVGLGERYTGTADLVDVARFGHFTEPGRSWEQIGFDSPVVHPNGLPNSVRRIITPVAGQSEPYRDTQQSV